MGVTDLDYLSCSASCYILLYQIPKETCRCLMGSVKMTSSFFSDEDLKAITAKGNDVLQVLEQLEIFRRGIKSIRLIRPVCVGDGIVQIPPNEREAFVSLH